MSLNMCVICNDPYGAGRVHFAKPGDTKPCPGSYPKPRKKMAIRPEFQVHMLNPDGVRKAEEIATLFSELLTKLEALTPDGRERAIVRTHLQDASTWAKRAMATLPENQQPPK